MAQERRDIRIRDMVAADLAGLRPLLVQLGYDIAPEEIGRRFRIVTAADTHAAWVAEKSGRLVGFLHIFERPALEKPPEAVLQAMAVDSASRRSGVGRKLVAKAEAWSTDKGYTSISLSSQIDRADAHAFYAGLGFTRAATSHLFRKTLDTPGE